MILKIKQSLKSIKNKNANTLDMALIDFAQSGWKFGVDCQKFNPTSAEACFIVFVVMI